MRRRDCLVLCLCAALLVWLAPSAGHGSLSAQEASAARRGVSVGTLASWDPEYLLDESGAPTGFAIEVWELVGERAGLDSRYEIFDSFPEMLEALRDGVIDVVPNCGITAERQEELAFTHPLETSAIRLFVRKEQGAIRGLQDLEGGSVAVVESNAAIPIVQAEPAVRAVLYDDPRTALFDLLAGQVDAFAYPESVIRHLAADARLSREIRTAGPPLIEIKRAIAVRRGESELLEQLNTAVEEIVGSSAYREVYSRWHGAKEPFWTPRRIVLSMGALLVATILAMTIWRYRAVVRVNRCLVEAVAERERAREELERSQAKLSAIFVQAHNAILLADDEGCWVEANPAACRLLGRSRDELVGSYPWDLAAEEARDEARELWRTFIEDGSQQGEFPLIKPSGEVVHVDYEAVANILPGLHLSILSDVTARKRAEEERAALERRLAQAQKMEAIGNLAGGIAHDFNNILTAILGYSELAKKEVPQESNAASHLDIISTAGTRARDLVRQILSFSRQDERAMRPVRLGPLVDEAVQMLRAILPASIELDVRRKVDGVVLADPVQVHQILINLCTNAMQAMEETGGGTLEVGLDQVDLGRREAAERFPGLEAGRYQLLWVCDEGVGMSEEVQRRIFEPFFTTKEGEQGTGLGLSVVHGIIAAHGGAVTVDSTPGRGTRFDIFLPLLAEEQLDPIEESLVTVPGGRERIMLVDDEETLIQLIGRTLTALGYEVDAFTSPEEALAALRESPAAYDLVLTDIAMPRLSGDDLVREMKRVQPELPIVLCTGFSERMLDAEEVRRLGARRLLMKPMLLSELALAVRDALDEPAPQVGA